MLNENEHEWVILQKGLHDSNNHITSNPLLIKARADPCKGVTDEYNLEVGLEKSSGDKWKRAHAMCEQTLSTMQSRLQHQGQDLVSGLDGEDTTINMLIK